MDDLDRLVGTYLGPYLLEEKLGDGGFGAVFRGRHPVLKEPRAIKVLTRDSATGSEYVRLFHREANLAAGLRHSNVVQIHDVAEHDGRHYLVMELLQGRSLRDVLREDRPLSVTRAIGFIRQLAAALDHAHDAGVAHRDVKPANAFVRSDDHLTLVDFGIARAVDDTHLDLTSGQPVGTVLYMAPELFDERLALLSDDEHAAATAADAYALGVVAYELLTGQVPFNGRSREAIRYAQVHQAPPLMQPLRPALSAPVEAVVLRQLAKRPTERVLRCGAFADTLAEAARPVSLLEAAQAALDRGDVDSAITLHAEAVALDPEVPLQEEIGREIARRRPPPIPDETHVLDDQSSREPTPARVWLTRLGVPAALLVAIGLGIVTIAAWPTLVGPTPTPGSTASPGGAAGLPPAPRVETPPVDVTVSPVGAAPSPGGPAPPAGAPLPGAGAVAKTSPAPEATATLHPSIAYVETVVAATSTAAASSPGGAAASLPAEASNIRYVRGLGLTGATLYDQPSSTAARIATLANGTMVVLLGPMEQVNGVPWYQVRAELRTGWVIGSNLALTQSGLP